MRVFVTKWFDRFASGERIQDEQLFDAIVRAEKGLIDAELGGGLIKQRIPRIGAGRSSGYRTIITLKRNDKAVFLHGFAKNEIENIDPAKLADLKFLSSKLLALEPKDFENLLHTGYLREKKI